MRKSFCILLLQFFMIISYAQKHEPVHPLNDKQEIDGFTVRLKEAANETYLFDILKDGKPVSVQVNNPFTLQPEGFNLKDDNYKVARWLIRQYKQTGYFPVIVPPHVGLELKIPIHRPGKTPSN